MWVPKGPWERCSQAGEAVGWRAGELATWSEGLGGGKRVGRGRAHVGLVLGLGEASGEAEGEMWEDGSQGQRGGCWALA